jgi:hypothetical protein
MNRNYKIFELKKEHLSLIKNLKWSLTKDKSFLISKYQPELIPEDEMDEEKSPFGGDNLFEDMSLIIYGYRTPEEFTDEEDKEAIKNQKYLNNEIDIFNKLFSELPTALEIILSLNTFEPGIYKTKTYDINWKKTK